MKKKLIISAVVFGVLLVLLKIGIRKLHDRGGAFTMACADRDRLKGSGAGIKDAVAYVATRHAFSIVLDKRIVVSGIPDITDEVKKAIDSQKVLASAPAPFSRSVIGVVDEEAMLTLPPFREAQRNYADVFKSLKFAFQKKAVHLSPEAKERLKTEYNAVLESYQQRLILSLYKKVESAVRRVGNERGLSCVIGRDEVLYGGENITPDVMRKVETAASELHPSGAPVLAVVNEKQLIRLHPFSRRFDELDREEESWKQGRYGIAEPLLSPVEVSRWEAVRQDALKAWEREVNRLLASTRHPRKPNATGNPLLQARDLALTQAALSNAYQQEVQKKIESVNKTYQNRIESSRVSIESALREYANRIFEFRKEKLAVRRVQLSHEFARRVKNHATALEEEYLDFEKTLMASDQQKKLDLQLKLSVALPAEKANLEDQLNALEKHEEAEKHARQEEFQRDLQTYRDKELVAIAETLKREANNLDQAGIRRMATYRDQLLMASRDALTEEQASLSLELKEFRSQALADARRNGQTGMAKKFQGASLNSLAEAGKADLEARLERERRQVEIKLEREEKEILAHSKAYQEATQAIKEGNRKIVGEVIGGLEEEKVGIMKTIRDEISKRAELLAQARGIQPILGHVAVNLNAVDLTPAVAKEMTRGDKR